MNGRITRRNDARPVHSHHHPGAPAARRERRHHGARDAQLWSDRSAPRRPQCGWPNAKALQAASGATEVLNRLSVFDRLEDAASDLHRVYATTARARDLPKPVVTAAQAAREARAALQKGEGVGILFGPERTGLSNDDLIYADAVVSIPVNPDFFSLNLAQAVLLVAYEWFESGSMFPIGGRLIRPAGCHQGRARPAAGAPDRRTRRGELLQDRRSPRQHEPGAAADLRPRRAARAGRAPAARSDQGAGPRWQATAARRRLTTPPRRAATLDRSPSRSRSIISTKGAHRPRRDCNLTTP